MPTSLRAKVFPGAIDCIVHDFSRRGARLGFAGAPPAGDHIVGVIWSTGFAFEAVTRWRSEGEIGVQFHSRFDLRRPVPARLLEIKAQWLGRRRRLRRRELIRSSAMIDPKGSPSAVRLS